MINTESILFGWELRSMRASLALLVRSPFSSNIRYKQNESGNVRYDGEVSGNKERKKESKDIKQQEKKTNIA